MANKIYEAPTLKTAMDQRTTEYENLREQLVILKKEFGKIVNDSEFQGMGAEAIKGFYQAQRDLTDAWLRLIDMTVEFFKGIPGYLEDAKLSGHSTVHVAFLEENVERGIKAAKDQVTNQQEALQSIFNNINDLVPLSVFSSDDLDLKMSSAEKKRKKTVEKVHELDQKLTEEYIAIQVQADQVSLLFNEMMNATRQGEHISPLFFNAEAYHSSEVYKLQSELTTLAADYVEQKKNERKAREVKGTKESDVKSVVKEKGLFESIGDGVWDGAGNAISDTVDGVVNMVKNPGDVVDGVVYTAKHPIKTGKAIADQVSDSWDEKVINGNAETRSEFFSYMGTNIAVGVLGSKGIDKVAKTSKLSKADVLAKANNIKYVVKKNSASYLDKINQLGRAFTPQQQVATAGGMYFRVYDVGDVDKQEAIYQASKVDDIVMKDGTHFLDEFKLKPNIKYKAGEFEYHYQTDENSRIKEFKTDSLKITKRESRLPHKSNTPGKKPGDHAGHLAGDRFGGSPDYDNLVSQSSSVNLSKYKKLENIWAKAIEEGKHVAVRVKINYEGDGLRPSSFDIEYEIDGRMRFASIEN
ncbi:T7SS effector LXG polymorphic toxin [Fictibacillus aquaticus]|uniref:LXG domain-containing protein n=1 Tax=Fictibacillus aquaticus TaxID=2021314 RepID=A0A235F8Y8_9BACL|nr:T7SS effector LXG polymorphic toxin [Fictibacillus aquaticus]OYD57165.1 hypothetical protein CGZ90_10750 [Fictibacillus aquaticus]